MIPVRQTILAATERDDGHDTAGRPGDCLRACVASLLELPANRVPHFAEDDDWWGFLAGWCRARGLAADLVSTDAVTATPAAFPHHVIATGPSPRGDWAHCVVVDTTIGGLMVHDPHPSAAGLAGRPYYMIAITDTRETR
jgi:hypothetical protein